METHAHELHKVPGHGWKHYLLEFFMLFLAVFLGFVAENIRENIAEQHREKEFMTSLLSDLKLDTSYINRTNGVKDLKAASIDTMMDHFKKNDFPAAVPFSLLPTMRNCFVERIFVSYSGTIDQLRNSGGLRLIHNKSVVDSIENYYQQLKRIDNINGTILESQANSISLYERFVDAKDIMQNSEHIPGQLVKVNTAFLNEYLNHLIIQRISTLGTKRINEEAKSRAVRLIELIQKQYHLSNE